MEKINLIDKNTDARIEISVGEKYFKGGIPFFKVGIKGKHGSFNAELETLFEVADFDILQKQLSFMNDARIKDFVFENIEKDFQLASTIDLSGNINSKVTLHGKNHSTKLAMNLQYDLTYLPSLIFELKTVIASNS